MSIGPNDLPPGYTSRLEWLAAQNRKPDTVQPNVTLDQHPEGPAPDPHADVNDVILQVHSGRRDEPT